ncbi:MAG: DNA repair protein RecN [Chloroflexi bacterium]|nr:DNA repair protein RecN [Chloroflexota bacterium]BCY17762.1 DNA repair protein RecN [Leptolinea sp. HRD-7]
MLQELRIDNFAIIQHLELRFDSGLVIFTGETGAGKSIILDAIEALVGGKAEAGMVRSGEDRALLEADFSTNPDVDRILEREDLLDEPGQVILSREIRKEGRTSCRVNGRSVSQSLLKEIGSSLVDIHGQSEHLSLLNIKQHIQLLDRFAGSGTLLSAYREDYNRLSNLRKNLTTLREQEKDSARTIDLLRYQVNEIESARLKPGELDELVVERDRLANAENLATLGQDAMRILDEGEADSPSASDLIGQVVRTLTSLARIDPSMSSVLDKAEIISDDIAELSRALSDYLERIEINPRRLEQMEDRIELIRNLSRKYGGSEEAALAFMEDARRQLESIEHSGEQIEQLEAEEKSILASLTEKALALSQLRKEAAGKLSSAVEAQLQDLHMPGARFMVDMRTLPDTSGIPDETGNLARFDNSGFDLVEFLIAPNPGEGLKPMVKIASGGETSRLMLALKNVLAHADEVPTLIFDEIDQGIGGRVGTTVGEKLWQVARSHQVFCVTHLPQLAAFGDQHFTVGKKIVNDRTMTETKALNGDDRIRELALMLGTNSEAGMESARALITEAGSFIEKASSY